MTSNILKSCFQAKAFVRAGIVTALLAFFSFAAAPSLGASDVPELPTGDGTGDTPDMLIKMVGSGATSKGGENLRLSTLRGRVAMIDMFWSQCPHCEEHAPHVVALYNQYRQRGFTVLGLATDSQDKAEDVKNFIRRTKINYPVGFITTEIVAYYADSHNHGVPQMVLFGPDGKMVKRLIGWNDKIDKELREAIEAQLAKSPTVKPGSKATSKANTRKTKQG